MSNTIKAQVAALGKQAEDALGKITDESTTEEIEDLVAKATEYQNRAQALKSALEAQERNRQAVLPGQLPMPGEGEGSEEQQADAIKAIYTLRFGGEDTSVAAILQDLHGADYHQQRWEHTKAFNTWLRDYTNPIVPAEGKQFLWTPGTIKIALQEGQDVSAMKATMVEAAGTLGGYIVPEDWRATIVERLAAEAVIRKNATVVTTSRDVYEQPKATGGDAQYSGAVRVTWVDETPVAGTAATNLTWGMEKIPVFTVMAETFFSRSQVEDAAFNLPAYLADKLAEASVVDEDNKFATGVGQGSPEGILPGGANTLSLTEVLSGASGAVAWDGLIGLYFAIPARYRTNAKWIAENATYAGIAKLNSGTGGEYYWREMYGMHAGSTPRPIPLMGKEALEQESLPTVAGSAYAILFGDLKGYTIVDRVGMSIERYLDSATARQDMVCYLMRRRLGGKVMEPWRFAVQKITA